MKPGIIRVHRCKYIHPYWCSPVNPQTSFRKSLIFMHIENNCKDDDNERKEYFCDFAIEHFAKCYSICVDA